MMKNSGFLAIAAAVAMMPVHSAFAERNEASATSSEPAEAMAPAAPAPASVIDSEGNSIGTATFEQTPSGVLISVSLEGVPPGEHGFHIHQTGICDPATGFKSAGGHFAPQGHEHGLKVEGGPHAGDMPNQFAAADGTLRAAVFDPNVTLGTGDNSLADADGSALVIHAGADDYTSQPSGAAGSRLACAVIRPPQDM